MAQYYRSRTDAGGFEVEREDVRVISVAVLAALFMLGSFLSAKLMMWQW